MFESEYVRLYKKNGKYTDFYHEWYFREISDDKFINYKPSGFIDCSWISE